MVARAGANFVARRSRPERLAVVRLCAKDGASLRRDLIAVIAAWGGTTPRLWLN
jgi:hypothetical protein